LACFPVYFSVDDAGRIEFARTPVPFKSAASESIMAQLQPLKRHKQPPGGVIDGSF